MECEQSDTLIFLDLKIRRLQDGSIEKTLFYQPTWSGQYLNLNLNLNLNLILKQFFSHPIQKRPY